MVDLVAELLAVVDRLRAVGVDHAVCGGLALAIHGHVRATKDIDLLVQAQDRDKALDALRGIGFDLPALPMTFGAGTPAERHIQRVSKATDTAIITLDLVVVEPTFVDVWSSCEEFERDGRRLKVVSRAGLISMKRLAGRTQDLADIEALERGAGDE